MKGIILAAGQGTRLSPLTDDRPKCMVEYNGKPIIDYILESMNRCGVDNIIIVDGYKNEVLREYLSDQNITFISNPAFASTNMVNTFFCAENFMDDDIIISYADIIYTPEILNRLINFDADFSCVVDDDWLDLWSLRMDNPYDDVESMIIDEQGYITELGKKVTDKEEIHSQYIGLIKISKSVIRSIREFYYSLDRNKLYDGKDFNNMYMTSFIQQIIDNLQSLKALRINGGWLEIDSVEDLRAYENLYILSEDVQD